MTWKAPQWRQRHEADSHRLWLRTPTYISGVLTKRNSVRCFSLIGDIKEELALISSSQCKQRFFGVSSNYYLKWWYTFYDWNSVDIISPDIYQEENGEVHVGWSKGDQPIFFLALHQWNFPWSDYCVSTVCLLCYLIPPAEVEAFHHSITEKQREDTQGRDKQTIYMNFYEHRKIRLSRELRNYTGLNSCTICWTARNAENHLLPYLSKPH